jgi:hypothetical protein
VSPPSLTAAGEPRPAIIAGRFSRDRCHHQSRVPIEIIICVDHNDSLLEPGRTGTESGSRDPREEHSIGTQLLRGE